MLNSYKTADYSDDFYMDAGRNGQSFMVVNDPSPVPEPSTLATFGTGLLAAAGFTRRRFLRS
jgi:PEP-CTERM motif